MSTQRVVLLLAALNVALGLLVVASYVRPTEAQTGPVLRGRALEIVDEAGRVRASINVAPAGTAAGVTYPETVILRLIDPNGRPTIKLAGSVDGGGLGIVGDPDQTYLILETEHGTSALTLLQRDGNRTVLGR